jgi:hypothetical protein
MNSDQFSRSGTSSGGSTRTGSQSTLSQGAQGSSRPSGQGAGPTGALEELREGASQAASKFAEVAQQAGAHAKQAASSLAAEANQKARGLLNQQIETGADLVKEVAGAARQAAYSLEPTAPQVAELVRGAADKAEGFSHDLRGQSVDDLFRAASDFTRRQPAVVFGLASLAGFLAFRVLKSGQQDSSQTHREREPDVGFRSQREQFGSQRGQFGQRASEFHGA